MMARRCLTMYTANSEQAVKMRGLARRLRHDADSTSDSWYRCQFHLAALDLEAEAERLERADCQQGRLSLH
jgi:hypothetical protein